MSVRRKQVQRILDATAADINTLDISERRRMILLLKQAELELTKELGAWFAQTDATATFTIRRNMEAFRAINGTLARLRASRTELSAGFKSVRKNAGQLSLTHLLQRTPQLQATFGAPFRSLNLDIVKILSKGDSLLLRRHNGKARRYSIDAVNHVQRSLSLGALRGESIQQVVQRLARGSVLDQGLPIMDRAANGLMRRPISDLNRLVRTETINAYNVYHTEGIKEAGLKKRWDASLDRRVCIICRGLDGEVVGPDEAFSSGDLHPPAHPNDRCTVIGWEDGWEFDSLPSEGTEELQS